MKLDISLETAHTAYNKQVLTLWDGKHQRHLVQQVNKPNHNFESRNIFSHCFDFASDYAPIQMALDYFFLSRHRVAAVDYGVIQKAGLESIPIFWLV